MNRQLSALLLLVAWVTLATAVTPKNCSGSAIPCLDGCPKWTNPKDKPVAQCVNGICACYNFSCYSDCFDKNCSGPCNFGPNHNDSNPQSCSSMPGARSFGGAPAKCSRPIAIIQACSGEPTPPCGKPECVIGVSCAQGTKAACVNHKCTCPETDCAVPGCDDEKQPGAKCSKCEAKCSSRCAL